MIDVAKSLSNHLLQVCNCSFSASFITDGKLICLNPDKLVYQGRLLATDGITAEEIRNLTQIWVLENPVIQIGNNRFQLESYCSVVLITYGELYCDTIESPTVINHTQSTLSAGVGVIFAIIITLVITILLFVIAFVCYKYHKKNRLQHQTIR